MSIRGIVAFIAALTLSAAQLPAAQPAAGRIEGRHAGGAPWVIDIPANWNGTLLLYAHGYSPAVDLRPPESAPRGLRDWLLANNYALAASAYTAGGWAVEEAPRDQLEVLRAFTERVGAPRRTIAWGSSMGGLVSLAMAERAPALISGALPLCGSVSGSLGMLNTALDGAFAFQTLVAPGAGIRVTGVDDDRLNAARVQRALDAAWQSPSGRARVMLAAALAQLPAWSDPQAAEPASADVDATAEQIRRTFVAGVFVPRTDQERRAGGIYGWNTGIDYRALLRRAQLAPLVRRLYAQAGVSLDADLAILNAAPRIAANTSSVAYMRANFVPTGAWRVPVLTLQTTGDGLTVPSTHGALAELTRRAGRSAQLAQLWVHGAGHCTLTPAETAAALATLEQRLDTGRWSIKPRDVAARAPDLAGERRFVDYKAAAQLRVCGARAGSCAGEPAPTPEAHQ
ncbi:MAG: alpha/beta hydrolase [Steroidobacteraceae bacterium]